MSASQTFIWTAVPNNITSDAAGNSFLRLSVFVTPRLATAGRLSDYPDLLDWPSTINGMNFTVGFLGGPVIGPTGPNPVRRITPTPLQDLNGVQITNPWTDLFDQNTPVRAFEFVDYAPKPKLTYSVAEVNRVVTKMHGVVADTQTRGAPAPVDAPTAPGDTTLLGSVAGYQRAIETAAVAPNLQVTEFHNLVASLCGYPQIAKRLGLIIDLEVPLLTSIPASSKVFVRVIWQPQLPVDSSSEPVVETTFNQSPLTQYQLRSSARKFLPASDATDVDIKNGMLTLNRATLGAMNYEISHFDAHTEALKLHSFQQQAGATATTEFPSLRSAGVGVSRVNLSQVLSQNFTDASGNNGRIVAKNAGSITLLARDLARGYRVDVRDSSGQWHSLCKRVGTYTFKRSNRQVQIEDEGWISLSAVRAGAPGVPDRLAIHDTMFRWDGWSLCVRRPSKSVRPGAAPLSESDTQETPMFSVSFKVPRSLPRLRFGESYALRARVVDVAGNSHSLEDEGDTLDPDVVRALDIPYVRYEPVPPPLPVLSEALTDQDDHTLPGKEGEAFDRMVVRTTPNGLQPGRRHLVPPRISQRDAETHGLEFFDGPSGLRPEIFNRILTLDRPLQPFHAEQQIELPYLPDPLAHTANILDMPGLDPNVPYLLQFVQNQSAWPNTKCWQLLLTEGNQAPSPSNSAGATDNIITIFLPQAEIRTVRLNSLLTEADLEKMGLWHLLRARHAPATLDFFRRRIIGPDNYCHERFTPCRELVLVHAVQQPLFAPQLLQLNGSDRLRVEKQQGATAAALVCDLRLPAKSASRVDLLAEWDEYLDEETRTHQPDEAQRISTKVFEILLPGDEKKTTPDVERCQLRGLSAQPSPPAANEPEFVKREHEFGDTKHRRVSYTFSALTRFADFFSEGTSPLTRNAEACVVHIPSSSRPPAPEPLYVIPTFNWHKHATNAGSTRTYEHVRRGRGARVYLKRPWFVSGENEFVGVVVAADPIGVDFPATVEQCLTRMGSDPIWPADPNARPPGYPRLRRFINALSSDELLTIQNDGGLIGAAHQLEEAGGHPVDIACHRAQYNRERKLWFVDVVIDTNDPDEPYFPFLKLALVRYQPFSLDGLHVSSLVMADSVQVAPDRTARVTIDSNHVSLTDQVTVEVVGSFVPGNEVTVSLEQPRAFISDEDIGWRPGTTTDLVMTPQIAGSETHWRATLPIDAQGVYRVVVKEFENLTSDTGPYKRLVYADTFRSDDPIN